MTIFHLISIISIAKCSYLDREIRKYTADAKED
jgi:hypothetical protein